MRWAFHRWPASAPERDAERLRLADVDLARAFLRRLFQQPDGRVALPALAAELPLGDVCRDGDEMVEHLAHALARGVILVDRLRAPALTTFGDAVEEEAAPATRPAGPGDVRWSGAVGVVEPPRWRAEVKVVEPPRWSGRVAVREP